MRPHRWQPTRLPCPWDSPGKNTGVGCHFLLQCMKVKSESEVAQSCLTLSDPMDYSLTGSSVHGIFQARGTGVGCHCLLRFSVLVFIWYCMLLKTLSSAPLLSQRQGTYCIPRQAHVCLRKFFILVLCLLRSFFPLVSTGLLHVTLKPSVFSVADVQWLGVSGCVPLLSF